MLYTIIMMKVSTIDIDINIQKKKEHILVHYIHMSISKVLTVWKS